MVGFLKVLGVSDFRARFAAAQLIVVGDVMLDEYLYGAASRISPEAPVPVVDVRSRRYVLGGAGNVAANVRSLGAEVLLCGLVGQDEAGRRVAELLSEAGIGNRLLLRLTGRLTTCKTRVVAGQQQIVRFDSESRGALEAQAAAEVLSRLRDALTGAQVCLLSDYGKGLLEADLCRAIVSLARSRGVPVVVDPKGTDYGKYEGCTLITPNLKEAGQATGIEIESEEDLLEAGQRLKRKLPGSAVLITRGAEGMTLFRVEQTPLTIPTVAQQVFDVVGAGDTVLAALSVSLAAGLPVEIGTQLANIAAGIAVGKPGTVAVSIDELLGHPAVNRLAG